MHRVGAGCKGHSLLSAIRRIARLFAVNYIGGNGQHRKGMLRIPVGRRFFQFGTELSQHQGIIGKISSALGEANINIEEMVNKSRGDIAYSVFDLNQHPSEEVLSRIASIEGTVKVRCIG